MSEINREKVAREWLKRGFICDLWVDPPGQRWVNFVHDVDEVVMVVEGEMEFEMEGQVHHLKVGDELLISARIVHSSRNIGSSKALWLYGYRIIH
jgi:quercetin dioxygenase-like cupin family protein